MIVLHFVEGLTAAGETLRVERVQRPMGSTLGVVFVRTLVNGQGASTEQFSHGRVSLADKVFKAAAAKIAGTTPEQAARTVARAAKPAPGAEQVLLDEGGVLVVMITGKDPRFEIRAPGREVEAIPATSAWRAEQKQAVERGRALIA